MTHREVADYLLPRRFIWLATPNELSRGFPRNQHIIDPTATRALRVGAAGMTNGITDPGKQWFSLTIPNTALAETGPVKLWLTEHRDRMLRVLAGSNYYMAKATQFRDLLAFGTAPMIIEEDFEDVIRCDNPSPGEYYVANGRRQTIDTLYREFVQTVPQVVREFGVDRVTPEVKLAFSQGGANLTREIRVCHAIEPNDDRGGGPFLPSRFKWAETYWQAGSNQDYILRRTPYIEQPFGCPRWDVAGNDAYGWCPGTDSLGLNKQLQLEQRRKAQAIDKMVSPPLKAHVSMKNQPAISLPGGVTYVNDMSSANSGIGPIYEVEPQLAEMLEDIKDVRQQIESFFFVDLFQMLAGEAKDMTAFEVAQRKEEKLVVLGPVLERNDNEGLDPDIKRVFAIMQRRGLIMPAPPEMRGQPLQIKYVSMLAEAQRASGTGALEQLVAFIGRLLAADPNAIDNLDVDETISEYADMIGASPKVIRAAQQIAQLRAARAQQQQQAAAMQQTMAGVQGAQTLSQTPIGQGTALDAVLGMGAQQ